MSGFYSRCLLNVHDMIGCDYLCSLVHDMAEENKPEVAEQIGTLKTLTVTKEGLRQLLTDKQYLPAKMVLHNALVAEISEAVKDEDGNVPFTCYYAAEYEASPEIAGDLIVGAADPDAIIAFAEGMDGYAIATAKDILVRADLYGKLLDVNFLVQNGPYSPGADEMRDAFSVLANRFTPYSGICFFDGEGVDNFPIEYELDAIRRKPEKYIVITLLFK